MPVALGVLLESPAEPTDESPVANPYAAELGELVKRITQLVAALPERELLELRNPRAGGSLGPFAAGLGGGETHSRVT